MSIMRDACHLRLAFRCMATAQPIMWRLALYECRRSKAERKRVLRDLRAHFWWPTIAHVHGVKP